MAQARRQAWEVAHSCEPPDEPARLAQMRDQRWLDSLAPHVRAYRWRRRRAEAEREAQAWARLETERPAHAHGEAR